MKYLYKICRALKLRRLANGFAYAHNARFVELDPVVPAFNTGLVSDPWRSFCVGFGVAGPYVGLVKFIGETELRLPRKK